MQGIGSRAYYPAESQCKTHNIYGVTYDESKSEFDTIIEKGKIEVKKQTVKRFEETTTIDALEFMLSTRNVSILSWGNKEVRIDDIETVIIPLLCLTRLVLEKLLFDSYCTSVEGPGLS